MWLVVPIGAFIATIWSHHLFTFLISEPFRQQERQRRWVVSADRIRTEHIRCDQ